MLTQQIPILFAFLLLLPGCLEEKSSEQQTDLPVERNLFAEGKRVAALDHQFVYEASGMVASMKNKSMIWVHNDSGDDPNLYLLDTTGNLLATYQLGGGAENRDWEDMAVGPAASGNDTILYLADIGDNGSVRPSIEIYMFSEPRYPNDGKDIDDFDMVRLQYSDHPHDAEALLIDPLERSITIVTKRDQKSIVFSADIPSSFGDTIVLQATGMLPFNYVTGGDISETGTEILLKTYTNIYYWRRDAGQTIDVVLSGTPTVLPYEPEPQGEAIAWSADGSGFYTLSERKGTLEQVLYFHERL